MLNVFRFSCLAKLTPGCWLDSCHSQWFDDVPISKFHQGFGDWLWGLCWQKQSCSAAQNSTSTCSCEIGRYWGSTPTNSPSSLKYLGVCFCLAPLCSWRSLCFIFYLYYFLLFFPLFLCSLQVQNLVFFIRGKKNPISEIWCFFDLLLSKTSPELAKALLYSCLRWFLAQQESIPHNWITLMLN